MNSTYYKGKEDIYKTIGWSDSIIGQSYLYLFPNDVHITSTGALHKPIVNTFQTGMLTLNFFNNYHLDMRDKDIPTHCSFSPPSSWSTSSSSSPHSVFGMGSVVVDLSCNDQRISFLPHQVKHCTSEPSDVPTLPSYLHGNCCSKTVLDNKNDFYSFVSKSMIAWGGWGRWSHGSAGTPRRRGGWTGGRCG